MADECVFSTLTNVNRALAWGQEDPTRKTHSRKAGRDCV